MRYLFTVPALLLTVVILARVGAGADAHHEKLNRPRIVTNSLGMKLAAVAEGQFLMGSADAYAQANQDETPQQTRTPKLFVTPVRSGYDLFR
jgi:formylglycine-generating enzyme required for sulfatase activity